MALELANRVYSYAVVTINIMTDVFFTDINLFAYNMTLFYTFIKFMGVIINTRAFKCFIVRYGQFLVL